MVEGIKYLGVEVSAKKDCFGENRKKIGVAEGMANVTYSMVARACERLMIEKVFWKSVVLPCVLSSAEVMVWRKAERDKLQRRENGVRRKVMGAPGYAPVVTLQGEVGCSSVESRDMKGKV